MPKITTYYTDFLQITNIENQSFPLLSVQIRVICGEQIAYLGK